MSLAIATKPATINAISAARPDILHGRAMLDGSALQYADAIKAGDMVAVNFDIKRASSAGGLYVIEATEGNAVAWQGCRRIISTPAGVRLDESGRGDWLGTPSLQALGLRIVGVVEQVLRPTMRH